MLEKIVVLKVKAAAPKGEGVLETTSTAPDEDAVEIKLYARAPAGECQLKLWDHHGQNPTVLEPKNPPVVIGGKQSQRFATRSGGDGGTAGRRV